MRLALSIATIMCAGLIGGCGGGANGGLVTSSISPGTAKSVKPATSGLGHAGTTGLSHEEQTFDCKQLAFVIGKGIEVLNGLPAKAKAERDAPPPSVVRAFSRLSGGGIQAVEDFDKEAAHVRALRQHAAQKSCPAIDIDAQIKAADDKIAAFRSH